MTKSYTYEYEDLLDHIRTYGSPKSDRTGTGILSVFGEQMRFDLSKGFPLITTKKVHTKSVVYELLWMLSGNNDPQWLRDRGVRIWNEWSMPDGTVGDLYGKSWRAWRDENGNEHDQITTLIDNLKKDPESRRHVVSAWNVGALNNMPLAPCHTLFQFYVANGKLSCQLYQRSADMFLGVPFNIAFYSLLTHMVAQQTGLEVGEFVWTGGDCHIYSNHFEQVEEQLTRTKANPLPTLKLNKRDSIFDYEFEDVVFEDYNPYPAIPAKVAV